MFLWTSGMQVWQSLQKYLAWRPGNVHLLSERDTKFYFPENKKFSPTCSSAHVECNFDNSWKSFGSRPEKFVQLPKMIEEVKYLWKFFFRQLFLWTVGMKALWQTRWKFLNRRPKNLRSLSKNEEGNKTWWEVFFHRSVPMVTLKAILLTLLEQVPWKAKIFRVDVQQGLEIFFSK